MQADCGVQTILPLSPTGRVVDVAQLHRVKGSAERCKDYSPLGMTEAETVAGRGPNFIGPIAEEPTRIEVFENGMG